MARAGVPNAMAYRDELEVARLHAERLEEENRALREHLGALGSSAKARSRLGPSIAMVFWTLAALSAGILGLGAPPDDPDAAAAADVTTLGDVVTPAPGTDWGDVRTSAADPL